MSYLIILRFALSTTQMRLSWAFKKLQMERKDWVRGKTGKKKKRHCPPRGYQPLQSIRSPTQTAVLFVAESSRKNKRGRSNERNKKADGASGRFRVAERRSQGAKADAQKVGKYRTEV
jgi:hypothetical protein